MPRRRRNHKKNQRLSNAKIKKLSTNAEGTKSISLGVLTQELPTQKKLPKLPKGYVYGEPFDLYLPINCDPAQYIQYEYDLTNAEGTMSVPQGVSAQELPTQELPTQELPTEESLPKLPKGYVYGDTFDIYLPISCVRPTMTQEKSRVHPLLEIFQRAARKNELINLEIIDN